MTIKGAALAVTAIAVSVGAAETHLATIDVIKHAGTVCGAIYGVLRLARIFSTWASHQVRAVVAEEIDKKLGQLPCVKNPSFDCPVPENFDVG